MDIAYDEFINLLVESFSDKNSKELIEFLKDNNLVLDVNLQYSYFDLERYYEVYLGSLYGGKFYTSKNELRKKSEVQYQSLTIEEKINTYKRISSELLILFKKGVFENLLSVLIELSEKTSEDLKNSIKESFLAIDIDYKINGIRVFQIVDNECSDEEFYEYGYDEKYYTEQLRKTTDFISIAFQSWYDKLSDDSQKFVKAGDKLVEFTLYNKSDGLIDFSPLLVDYFKALEVEISLLFKNNFDDIIKTAEIIRKLNFDDKTYSKGELNSLRDFADTIYKYKSRYDVSGTKPLYYLLKYFGLGNIIKEIVRDFKSVFSYDKLVILEKEYLIIDRINELGKNRNTYIHSGGILEAKNSFLIIYSDIFSIMNLLSQLK